MIQVGPSKIKTRVLVLTAAALSFTGVSKAGLLPFFNSGPITTGNSFQYNYTASVQADSRLDSAAISGVSCPGPSGSQIACAAPSTFFTLFSMPGPVSASPTASFALNGWNTVIQNAGFTPSVGGSVFNASGFQTTNFMASGPVFQAGPATLPMGDFEAFSNVGYVNQVGYYNPPTSRTATSRTTQISTTVPNRAQFANPEPSSVLLLGTGLAGLLVLRRKYSRSV